MTEATKPLGAEERAVKLRLLVEDAYLLHRIGKGNGVTELEHIGDRLAWLLSEVERLERALSHIQADGFDPENCYECRLIRDGKEGAHAD